MLSKTIKLGLSLLFAAAFLAGCASTSETESTAPAPAPAPTPAETAPAPAPAPAPALATVFYFDFDSSSLTDEARGQVDAHIAALLGNNDSVRLEGHTDERGTREYNLALGERRANAVRDYMVANGVPGYRIETISYGEENPVAYGSGESNWQQNRRVELK